MALMIPSNPLLALQALGGLLDLWDPGWGSSLLLVTSCPLLQQQLPEAAPTAAEQDLSSCWSFQGEKPGPALARNAACSGRARQCVWA